MRTAFFDQIHHNPEAADLAWHPVRNIGLQEGALPELGLPVPFRWFLGPDCELNLLCREPGKHLVAIECVNKMFDPLEVALALDGDSLSRRCLPRSDEPQLLYFTVDLGPGKHSLTLSFDKWAEGTAEEPRCLALVFQRVQLVLLEAGSGSGTKERFGERSAAA